MDKINSIILINKPSGMTSFSVTSAVRRKTGIKKAGHAGTLDPLASGVLPVMTGRATRLIDLISDNKKHYIAEFMLGITTDTLDCEGEVLTEQPVTVDEDEISAVTDSFSGAITQIPPMYSALKKDGKKLYELAREGITVEREPRTAFIYSIKLAELERYDDTFVGSIDVICSKGTYIRTLIDDIGIKLKCGAFMTGLQRVSSCGFSLDECVNFDEFINCDDPKKYMHSPDFALRGTDKICVTAAQAKRFSNGGELDLERLRGRISDNVAANAKNECIHLCVYDEKSEFLGLGEIRDGSLWPKCVF